MGLRSAYQRAKSFVLGSIVQGFSLTAAGYTDPIDQAIRKYKAVTKELSRSVRCIPPPHDPYELHALLTANGYHERAIRLKVAATVGQGYTGSAALLNHIKQANFRESFQRVLRKWAFDAELTGNAFVSVVSGENTSAIYHQPAIKTRIKFDRDRDEVSYIRYEYEYGGGMLYTLEYPEYESGDREGMRHFALGTPSGNRFYGEPEYTSIKPLLLLNRTIVDSALRFYKHGLQSDKAMIMKGGRYKDEELRKMREYMQKSVTGIENARKVLFLKVGPNEDVNFVDLNHELQTAETGKVRNDNRDEIATGHGVLPRLLGIVTAGSLGGPGELEAQLKAFKLLFADERQRDYEEWWQDLFAELGFPDPYSFRLNPMEIVTGTIDAQTLATLVGAQILSPQQAQNEWLNEKNMDQFASWLSGVRKAVEYGE